MRGYRIFKREFRVLAICAGGYNKKRIFFVIGLNRIGRQMTGNDQIMAAIMPKIGLHTPVHTCLAKRS